MTNAVKQNLCPENNESDTFQNTPTNAHRNNQSVVNFHFLKSVIEIFYINASKSGDVFDF